MNDKKKSSKKNKLGIGDEEFSEEFIRAIDITDFVSDDVKKIILKKARESSKK